MAVELHRLRTLHLFAGAGGGILGDILLGHQTIGAVEIDPYCQQVISARQEDGSLPWFPIFDDVTTFDGRRFEGLADIVAGGFPCQDISAAGKGAGITGERSGLWSEFSRIIGEVRPRFVFVENSPLLISRGLDTVLSDLAEMGFNAEWGIIGAHHAGGAHYRDRIWILAYADSIGYRRWPGEECGKNERVVVEREQERCPFWSEAQRRSMGNPWYDKAIAGNLRKNYELADWVDRLKAIGNGQVPAVAALAFMTLYNRITDA